MCTQKITLFHLHFKELKDSNFNNLTLSLLTTIEIKFNSYNLFIHIIEIEMTPLRMCNLFYLYIFIYQIATLWPWKLHRF